MSSEPIRPATPSRPATPPSPATPSMPTAVPFAPLNQAIVSGATRGVSGYAEGYAIGWAAGSRAAASKAAQERREEAERAAAERAGRAARVEQALAGLGAAARAARARAVPTLAEVADELTKASIELAEAALGAELSDRGAAVRAALARALSAEGEEHVVRIRLNPQDLAALGEVPDLLGVDVRIPAGVELVADASLAPGDAISEFEDGILDARISTALRRIRNALDPGS